MVKAFLYKMKQVIVFLLISLPFFNYAQHQTRCTSAQITFETPEKVNTYQTGMENLYGFSNENYAIEIEVVPLSEESNEFRNNIKDGAYEFANDMGFYVLESGKSVPNFKNSFYLISHETEEKSTIPVFILAIINDEEKLAYEVTVYCYNQNIEAGRTITESFKTNWLN